jgi:hypothetical protein
MDRAEIAWRVRTAAQNAISRARASVATPKWDRRALLPRLGPLPELADLRNALGRESWLDAHQAFSRHVAESPQRFVIAPSSRESVVRRVVHECPSRAHDAAARAGQVVAGAYDLLGYAALRFDSESRTVDWHRDPVHRRRAPMRFWSNVPFLDAACGDHKIIWELNRHQHWLTLGRGFWLTGDSRFRERMIAELASWLDANPPFMGINWASMLEVGFRSLSWLWALNVFADPAETDAQPWSIDLLVALDRQLGHIARNLSYYFSPNTHLLGEALALYVTGRAMPIFVDSGRREAIGRHILCEEIGRQIASDGGHRERSAHYHRYTLDFYLLALLVAEITNDTAAARHFESAVTRLASAARLLADDQGRLPHVGDDDGGDTLSVTRRATDDVRSSLAAASLVLDRPDLSVGPPVEDTYWLLAHPRFGSGLDRSAARTTPRPHPKSAALTETGYYISRSANGDHLLFDSGPHGYQNGGHAHADALALTLTVRGVPLLIDPGTGSYTADLALRDRLRSTPFHNTLTIDGRSQSTPAGPFHWTTTADATMVHWRADADFDYFVASHDGYRPLEHRRHVLAKQSDIIVVADLVAGDGHHQADVYWHIDPRWHVDAGGRRARFVSDSDIVELVAPQGRLDLFVADAATGLGWHSPAYGRLAPSATLRLQVSGRPPLWIVSVFGLDADNEIVAVDVAPATGSAIAQGIVVSVSRATSIDRVFMGGEQGSYRRKHVDRRLAASG